jgi:signal-transduction protein with cAMP-binding, CBS, and nucleotidyltransferase domain
LIYLENAQDGNKWFLELGEEISAILDKLGIIGPGGMKPLGPAKIASVEDWHKRIATLAVKPGAFGEIARICDLRTMAGESEMAQELLTLACDALRSDQSGLQAALRTVSTISVGFNFFGRLKLEKKGGHRGEFNLIQSTLTPMVLTIRILAIRAGILATSTPERIRLLLEAGELGVTQTAKLLRAYYDFIKIKVLLEIDGKGGERFGFYFEPDEMAHDQELSLKQGLDALSNLQRIVYQSVEA